jgi:hypothetical protein
MCVNFLLSANFFLATARQFYFICYLFLAIGIYADEFGELISLVPGLERLDCG